MSRSLRQRHVVETQNQPNFVENRQKQYNAKIYRYTRPIDHKAGPKIPNYKIFQHWGVVIEYLDEDKDEHLPATFIYEANEEYGKLWVRSRLFKEKEKFIQGADLGKIAERKVCKQDVEDFCQLFNQHTTDFEITDENCQKFTNELLIRLGLPTKYAFINFIENVAHAISKSLHSSYVSLSNIIPDAVKYMCKSPLLNKTVKDAMMKLGITTCEKMAEQLTNEILENLIRCFNGACCWWQLFQIPAEIITRYLVESSLKGKLDEKDSKALAYGSSKAASLGTAAVVGGSVAGPVGICGAVVFWLVAEVIFAIIRAIIKHHAGDEWVNKVFGQADYEKFFDACERIVVPKMQELCTTAYKLYSSSK